MRKDVYSKHRVVINNKQEEIRNSAANVRVLKGELCELKSKRCDDLINTLCENKFDRRLVMISVWMFTSLFVPLIPFLVFIIVGSSGHPFIFHQPYLELLAPIISLCLVDYITSKQDIKRLREKEITGVALASIKRRRLLLLFWFAVCVVSYISKSIASETRASFYLRGSNILNCPEFLASAVGITFSSLIAAISLKLLIDGKTENPLPLNDYRR